MHFPDSDETWRDADSIDLLRATCVRLEAVTIVNVDATVVAERPKLAGYIDAMRSRLADAMGLDRARVSVKATTAETMGALGREEGIAAIAIATVNQPEAA
jgi:2-C-methyl-D-erythritol 2,4-cyclodiphosphate synthase